MPVFAENGFELRLVAGEYKGIKGPASTFTPILALMLHFEDRGETEIQMPALYNALLYVLEGEVEAADTFFEKFNLGVFQKDGEGLLLKAKKRGKALLLAGEPINESVVSYGPFAMNYPGEIKQAILDYEGGKMGVLES